MTLVSDENLRKAIAGRCRRLAVDRYSYEAQFPIWQSALGIKALGERAAAQQEPDRVKC